MIILDATTRSIEVILAGAVATVQPQITSSWVDLLSTDGSYTPGSNALSTNSTTLVTLVAAPAASTTRHVKQLSAYNLDSAAVTLTVRVNDNSTLRILVKTTLAIGDTLMYTDSAGWRVLSSTGVIKGDQSLFALLAGRSGGQTLYGDTGASGNLTLRSTSNATKGKVLLADDGGNVQVGGGTSASAVRWFEPSGDGTNYFGLKAQAMAASTDYTLPAADAAGVLTSDGAGALSWAAAGGQDITAARICVGI